MNAPFFSAAVGLLVILSSCVMPDPQGYPPTVGGSGGYGQGYSSYPSAPTAGGNDAPAQPPTYGAPAYPQQPRQDYPPHLLDEYRNGHNVGVQDRSYGYPNDYARAYARFGRGYESYFQEGYADGYNGRPAAH